MQSAGGLRCVAAGRSAWNRRRSLLFGQRCANALAHAERVANPRLSLVHVARLQRWASSTARHGSEIASVYERGVRPVPSSPLWMARQLFSTRCARVRVTGLTQTRIAATSRTSTTTARPRSWPGSPGARCLAGTTGAGRRLRCSPEPIGLLLRCNPDGTLDGLGADFRWLSPLLGGRLNGRWQAGYRRSRRLSRLCSAVIADGPTRPLEAMALCCSGRQPRTPGEPHSAMSPPGDVRRDRARRLVIAASHYEASSGGELVQGRAYVFSVETMGPLLYGWTCPLRSGAHFGCIGAVGDAQPGRLQATVARWRTG